VSVPGLRDAVVADDCKSMENFITGFPGHESQHRFAMLKVLGQEKYDFFFEKWLEYFFTEADAKYFASLGLNCLRIPFSYKHFEDDMNPRVLKTEGFKQLDRVIDLVRSMTYLSSVLSLIAELVCQARDLHHSGLACSSWRPQPKLACRQSNTICGILGF
jgi:hypothetical protein